MKADKRILLVDDEADIREVLGVLLADFGYDVYSAENGAAALSLFHEKNPPIVLTDIKMPGMDGIELLRRIKEASPDTEVVMITGHGDMELAIESLKLEATDFVTKPIRDDVLEIALNRAEERISMRSRLREYTENLENLVREKSEKLVELERQAAVGQAVTGFSSAIMELAGDLEGGLRSLNDLPCFVSVHDRDLKVVAANERYTKRLGNRAGLSSCALYESFSRDRAACPVARTFKTGAGMRFEDVLAYPDGGRAPVIIHTAPIRNQEGRIDLVLEITADASEMKRLQQELRQTRQKYQTLFDEAPCYITVQNPDLQVTAANRRFAADFGSTPGAKCFKVYKHRDKPCDDCPVMKTFDDGRSHQAEMTVTTRSGEQNNVLIWTAPILDENGEIAQVMEMSTDITRMRKLQDHLSSLGFLIGSVSHGIKGLLTGLDGGSYLVESGLKQKDLDRISEGWDIVRLMAHRIRGMVLDILFYAKERNLNWETVDVLSFSEEVALTVMSRAQENEVRFIRRFDPSLGKFMIDPAVVRSALVNILENALDAVLADTQNEERQVIFGVSQDERHILFDVIDNGIGMDRETRENMFTLFFSSKGHGGTGLGLFISSRIIEQHGGDITVESEPGRGAHFCVRMPKEPPVEVKAETPES